ncbi:STAS domain-containing protein [Streptomyces sp. NPDC046805]|uniref:STAS domain-containing protein n=1 Tax=Streptomyces sp. NPDC046805 TaxID=3155134 RepID=UPI0033DD5DA9
MEAMEAVAHADDTILRITPTTDPPGLRLEGELDATRHGDLAEALSALGDGAREVRLDLDRLSFIDLGALSLLTSFAERGGGAVRLVLDHLSPDVENLIETVGWERLPGLVQGRKGAS